MEWIGIYPTSDFIAFFSQYYLLSLGIRLLVNCIFRSKQAKVHSGYLSLAPFLAIFNGTLTMISLASMMLLKQGDIPVILVIHVLWKSGVCLLGDSSYTNVNGGRLRISSPTELKKWELLVSILNQFKVSRVEKLVANKTMDETLRVCLSREAGAYKYNTPRMIRKNWDSRGGNRGYPVAAATCGR